jgi:RNase P/RNase MRP subunit POP5
MRPKRRYIAFEVVGGEASRWEVKQAIENSLRVHYPSVDRAMLKLVVYEADSGRGVVRCGHRCVDEIKVALAGVQKIGAGGASLSVLGVSGTIRAAKRKFLSAR